MNVLSHFSQNTDFLNNRFTNVSGVHVYAPDVIGLNLNILLEERSKLYHRFTTLQVSTKIEKVIDVPTT